MAYIDNRNFVIVEESTQYDSNNSFFAKIDVSRNLKEFHRTPNHETKRNAWSTNAKQRVPRDTVTHFPSRTRETLSSPDNSKKPQLLRRRFKNTALKRWSRRLAGYTRLTTTKPRPSGVVKWCNRPVSVACAYFYIPRVCKFRREFPPSRNSFYVGGYVGARLMSEYRLLTHWLPCKFSASCPGCHGFFI